MTSSYNNITGTDSANTLIGSTGSDSFSALKGEDNVLGGGAGDIVDLGAGNDSVNFSTDMDGSVVYGKGGNDSLGITVSVNTSTLSGGIGNDTLWMTKGVSAYLTGDLGSDTINFVGSDFKSSTVYGGNTSDATSADGADSIAISGTMSASLVQGNGGNDTMFVTKAVTASSSVVGGQGTDDLSLQGSVTGSVVSGNLGNDTMKLDEVVLSSSVYGGGGFLYDTSLMELTPSSSPNH